MTRDRLLREACELVVRIMNLRPPQAEALRALRDALLRLPTRLQDCSQEQRPEFLAIREGGRHAFHPTFSLSLATGVGKTRLAGAIIAMLWLTAEARTFLILAPRRAVLRRFESALDPRFREYIFVDPNLVPEPSIVRSDEIDGPRAFEFDGDLISQGPKIFLLSPQLVATSERFQRNNPLNGVSPAEALANRRDLVVIVDEAHHVGRLSSRETTAWAGAIRALKPCLQIGMSVLPQILKSSLDEWITEAKEVDPRSDRAFPPLRGHQTCRPDAAPIVPCAIYIRKLKITRAARRHPFVWMNVSE
jgi:type III restriction enzyme